MTPTITIDTSGFQRRMEELHDALIGAGKAGDAATIVEDEARLFVKQVIRLTPPKNKAQGEKAVARDLSQIFTGVSDELLNTIGSDHGVSGIDAWLSTDGKMKLTHAKWDRIDPTGSGMEAHHRAHQNARGRTEKLKKNYADKSVWYAPYVVSHQDYANYVKNVQSYVGRRKAAWAVSYQKIGGTVTRWISKHVVGAKGLCVDELKVPNRPSVVMVNFAPGIREDERIVRSALRIRMSAMKRRMRLVLSGYSKDVASGLRIARKERPAPPELAE